MKWEPYTKYKPSGVDGSTSLTASWLGDVPEHWEIKKLKFIGYAIIGLTYSPDDIVDEDFTGDKYLVLRSTNIQEGKISLHNNVYVVGMIQNELKVKKWDILICARNGSRDLVGKNALITEDNDQMTFGAFTTVFRSKLNPFLFYFFSSEQFKYQSTGFLTTTINQLTNSNLNSIIAPLPSMAEQQKIIEYLNKETSRIDTLIEKKQSLIKLIKEKRSAMISRAVTKGLDSSVKLKPSGVEWLGDVPEHWLMKKIKYIKSTISNAFVDGPFGSNLKTEHFVTDGDAFVIESNFATRGILIEEDLKQIEDSHFETIKRSETKEGDIIIAKIGAYFGLNNILPPISKKAVVSGNSMKLTINKNICDLRFTHYQLLSLKRSGAIDLLVSTTAQPALSLGEMNSLNYLLPPLSEQEAISEYLDIETAKIDSLVSKVESAIEKLKEYRTAIISAAVTGKINVSEMQNMDVENVV